jgi:hypothetical protein
MLADIDATNGVDAAHGPAPSVLDRVFSRLAAAKDLPRVFLCRRHDLGRCADGYTSNVQPCAGVTIGCTATTGRYTTVCS